MKQDIASEIKQAVYWPKDYEETTERLALQTNTDLKALWSTIVITLVVVLCAVLFFGCNQAHAQEYTDEQIVNAIRKAEGTWTYGIKSIRCETTEACRKICLNTVKNNRKRFARIQEKRGDFIAFLGSKYCPVGAENDPTGLNKNWEKNVRYFLARAK